MIETTKTKLDRILELPNPKERLTVPKRFVQEPALDSLTDEQAEALDSIVKNCLEGDEPMHLLLGYAGTGKTFLTGVLLERILHNNQGRVRIAITAPTNKAVKVIKDACPVKDTRLKFGTVHSLLGLREKIDGYGNVTYVQMKAEHATIGEYTILIVDETSMLPDNLFEMLNTYTSNKGGSLKIILIGDPAQIPPVGKTDCIPFTPEGRAKYSIGLSELTNIVRQAKGHPLIELSMKLRNNLGRPEPVPVKEDAYNEETMDGVYFLNMDRKADFHKLLDTYFKSENYLLDSDFVKIIGWRNDTVRTFNSLIRLKIYGEGIAKICDGERLIVNKPISDADGDLLFTTNDELTVMSIEIAERTIREMDLKFYLASVKLNGSSNDFTATIKILHEDSEELFKEYVSLLLELAKREKQGTWQAAEKWQDFYKFQEIFADVSYSYAISCHKAQGSTYDNAFVLSDDMDANRKIIERNRIKYTGFTRPRNKLFIID